MDKYGLSKKESRAVNIFTIERFLKENPDVVSLSIEEVNGRIVDIKVTRSPDLEKRSE